MDTVADGALQTALAEFARQSWVMHRTFEGSDSLRQIFAAGVLDTPRSLVLFDQAIVCLETVSRRAHAFCYTGPTLRLEEDALEELGALADAIYDQGLHDRSIWSIDYIEGVGCRIPEGQIKLRETGYVRRLRGVTGLGMPSAQGTFGEWTNLPLLSLEWWEEEVGKRAVSLFIRSYPQFEGLDATPMRPLVVTARAKMDGFVSALQPAAVDACTRIERSSFRAFNAFACVDDQIGRLRSQAAAAIPILGLLCAERWESDMLAIRLAIDGRRPLIKIAARSFNVPKDVIRFLSGKSTIQLGLGARPEAARLWIDSPGVVLKALAAIAPEHRPCNFSDWLAFYHFLEQFEGWHTIPRELIEPFFKGAGKRGLQATREWMAKRHGSDTAIADCQDFLHNLMEELPLLERQIDYRRAICDFAVARGMQRLLDDSRCWHRAVPREVARRLGALEELGREATWVLPIDLPKVIDGFHVAFLDRYSALVEEGLRMSHCVATLCQDARTGARLVFSLRTLAGQSLASFDISLKGTKSQLEVVINELRGPRNADVPSVLRQAVTRFLFSVQVQVKTHQEAVRAWLDANAMAQSTKLDRSVEDILRAAKGAAIAATVGGYEEIEHFFEVHNARN